MKHSVSILILLALCLNCFGQEDEHMDRKALRDSLLQASNVLAYHPDSLDLRLRKAKWNILLEEWQYAREEYDYVLNRQPDNVAALFYRAFVNEKQHRYKFARLDLEHLLYIVPGNFEATLGLALLNQKDNRHTEAMNMINLLVEQHPANALAYAARAGMEAEALCPCRVRLWQGDRAKPGQYRLSAFACRRPSADERQEGRTRRPRPYGQSRHLACQSFRMVRQV